MRRCGVDASDRPTRDAHDALALLSGAADEGLNPSDYGAAPLERLAAALEATPTQQAQDVAAIDTGLSVNTLRCLRHLHAGRVDPRAMVKHFQIRHGLQADGVIGQDTQAALRVPLSWRVRQIEFALERLRWLPHLGEKRFVAVNIPMFRLWAWDEEMRRPSRSNRSGPGNGSWRR